MNTDWKNEILDENLGSNYSIVENTSIYIEKGHKFENSLWNESKFAERGSTEFTTTWCEHLFVEKKLENILDNIKLNREWLCIDLGCSDGRFVKFLLKLGVTRIVALNFELLPLKNLEKSLTTDEKNKVLLMCGDFLNNSFKKNTFDFTIAWGFWSSTKDFKLSQDLTLDITKKNGYILNAEPILEQHLIYSLIRGDVNEFLYTLENNSRPVSWENKVERYKVNTEQQILAMMTSKRFHVLHHFGISSFYSYIFGSIAQHGEWSKERKLQIYESINNVAEFLNENRQIAFFSKKVK